MLTLFATTQADRIERPDRSTLRGRLYTIGNWLIAASVLPALTLAIALGFQARGHGGRLLGHRLRRRAVVPAAGHAELAAHPGRMARVRPAARAVDRDSGLPALRGAAQRLLAGHHGRGPDDRPQGVRVRRLAEGGPTGCRGSDIAEAAPPARLARCAPDRGEQRARDAPDGHARARRSPSSCSAASRTTAGGRPRATAGTGTRPTTSSRAARLSSRRAASRPRPGCPGWSTCSSASPGMRC